MKVKIKETGKIVNVLEIKTEPTKDIDFCDGEYFTPEEVVFIPINPGLLTHEDVNYFDGFVDGYNRAKELVKHKIPLE